MINRGSVDSDINRAKALVRRYDRVNLLNLQRTELESLVRIYYNKIRGTPISNLPNEQIYRIAKRLCDKAYETLRQERKTGLEGAVSS